MPLIIINNSIVKNILLIFIIISCTLGSNNKHQYNTQTITSPNPSKYNLDLFAYLFQLISDAFGSALSSSKWIIDSIQCHLKVVARKPNHKTYDFIVIGAGAAGSVVASRLSENPNFNVLLVEAGGTENLVTDTPGMYGELRGSQFDWAFVSEPEHTSAYNFDDNRVVIPRGKAMGGTTVINGMLYLRGAAKGYDEWASLGLKGWSFDEVFPFFLRSEGNTDKRFLANGYHNNSGPLTISSHMINSNNLFGQLLVNACKEFGFPEIDLNGFNDIGTNLPQQNIAHGLRVSASKAFLEPIIEERKNLDVLDNAMVTKVLFSSDKRAIGVEIDCKGFQITLKARKEVVISAGAIGSPQLLLLSGIGSRDQLRKFNIPMIADLPGVGENLMDHMNIVGPSFSLPSNGAEQSLSFKAFNDYLTQRNGPLAFQDQSICQMRSSLNEDINWSDIQINADNPYNTNFNNVRKQLGIKRNVWNRMYGPYVGRNAFLLRSTLMRPKSRGRVYLKSNDISGPPLIQLNYFNHSDDIKVQIEGLRWTYRMAQTKAFKDMNAEIFDTLVVGCEHLYTMINDDMFRNITRPNDQYLECVARHMCVTDHHMSGTCKMGLKSDWLAVVDNQLNVFGVSGLRVIDASIMPIIANKNIMAATIMIGERGVQFIIDSYKT